MNQLSRHLPVAKENLVAILNGNNIVIQVLSFGVILTYFLGFIPASAPYLALTPAHVLPQNYDKFWTLLTSWLFEFHWWLALADILIILLYGKLLEPIWGARQLFGFFFGLNITCGLCVCFIYIMEYYATGKEHILFERFLNGQSASVAGFTVVVKQAMGNEVIVTTPFGKIRNRDIPLLLLIVIFVFSLLGVLTFTYTVLYCHGLLFSWVYVRFLQKHSNGKRGDFTDGMAFASFFPSVVQPYVARFGDLLFALLVRVKVCKKRETLYNLAGPELERLTDVHVVPDLDDQRRKQKARDELNKRLAQLQPSLASPQPGTDWDDEDASPSSAPAPSASPQHDKPLLVKDLPASLITASGTTNVSEVTKLTT